MGAYALAAHGFPRATAEMDVFVKPSPANAALVMKTLQEFGAPLADLSADDFSRPGITLQIGVAPRRIDVITKIDGLTYDEAAAGKEIIEIEGLSVPVISKPKLIINKLATGREKDQLDARNLLRS